MEKEITRTATAADRNLNAFENNTLDPALLQDRLPALKAKTTQLHTRRDELTDLLDQAPTMPTDHELDLIADHIDRIIDHSQPAQRKALIEALVEEIQVIGPGRIRPVYRIPRHIEKTNRTPPKAAPRFAQWATWWSFYVGTPTSPFRAKSRLCFRGQTRNPCTDRPAAHLVGSTMWNVVWVLKP